MSKPIEEIHGFIKYYLNREKEWIDIVESKASTYYFDIHDINFLENSILLPLRKESCIPYETLINMDIEDVIILYLQLNRRALIENARFWFRSTLQEIERKAKEQVKSKNSKGETIMEDPDPELVEKRKKQLYPKYFRKEKPNEKNI